MAATETLRQPTPAPPEHAAVIKELSTLDRFLPLWIGLAMAAGLGLGRLIPSLNDGLNKLQVGTVSLPIALGLLLMMYPVLAKVRYEDLGRKQHDGVSNKLFFGVSLFLSWVIGPLLMFALAWLLLPNQPAYRTGVIIVGLARCIAMVLIWNDLAKGDRDRTALLVVFNALFQVAAFAFLGYFYLTTLPGWLGHARPFDFELNYEPAEGMQAFVTSSPSIVALAALDGALDVWDRATMTQVRAKSLQLTDLFIELVEASLPGVFDIVTPRDHTKRGSQVALRHPDSYGIIQALLRRGVIGDFRDPDIARFGFTPLYLRFVDVFDAVEILVDVVEGESYRDAKFAVRNAVT